MVNCAPPRVTGIWPKALTNGMWHLKSLSFVGKYIKIFFSCNLRFQEQGIPGVQGVDTRQLTKVIREKGTMRGRIVIGDVGDTSIATLDLSDVNLVEEVSVKVV